MNNDQPAGPPTHTVYYSGHHFQVAQEQAARIIEAAFAAAHNGTTTVMGIPAADTGNGHTVFRYISIGAATPILVEGPALPTSSGG
jgi:hypothetical protein